MSEEELENYSESIKATLRDSDSGRYELRQIVLGMSPMVLIEPEIDDDAEEVIYRIDATDFDSVEDLADMLRALADGISTGTVTEEEADE